MCAHQVGDGLFVFGVDAADVPSLREDRKDFETDPRWVAVMDLIKAGTFGDDTFEALVASVDDMKVSKEGLCLFITYCSQER